MSTAATNLSFLADGPNTSGVLSVGYGGTGTSTAFTAGSIHFSGASGVYSQNNGNLFWDNTNLRLGVGTASPAYLIDGASSGSNATIRIKNTGTGYAGLTVDSSSSATQSYTFFNVNGTEVARIYGNASNYLGFAVTSSATEAMRINSSGQVGIGTTSPYGNLTVSSGNSAITIATTDPGTGAWIRNDAANMVISTNVGDMYFGYSGSTKSLHFMGGGGTTQMLLNSSGQLGIGTSSPGYPLQVNGVAAATQFYVNNNNSVAPFLAQINGTTYFSVQVGGTSYFGGNVGIGTTSPTQSLTISTSGGSGHLSLTGSNQNGMQFLSASGGVGFFVGRSIGTNNNNDFYIYDGVASTTRFAISNTGAVSVTGTLSKGGGSFRIDHPIPAKSEDTYLVHSFIEGPKADLIYRGQVQLVNGSAQVDIDQVSGMTDGTFVLLNQDVQCFTTNESDWTLVKGSVSGNILTIEAQDPTSTATISWMVIGERADKFVKNDDMYDKDGHVIVEIPKPPPIPPLNLSNQEST